MDYLHLDVVFNVALECSQGNGSTPQNYIMKLSQVKGLAERLFSSTAELTKLQARKRHSFALPLWPFTLCLTTSA
jgi:hypothetical protein